MNGDEVEASMAVVDEVGVVTDPDVGLLEQASQVGDAAAMAAGVTVRTVTELADLAAVMDLFTEVWGRHGNPPLTLEMLRALATAGNYVGTAWCDARLVGACVGFFHAPSEDALHSHIAGVSPGATGRSIGFALKLHQRAWALGRGVGEVAWTYDPLVSRNAWFNLVKLGARPVDYLTNFYGAMHDSINGSDDTDRLLVSWRLADPAVAEACAGRSIGRDAEQELSRGAAVLLADVSGAPVRDLAAAAAEVVLVRVPPDIEAMRSRDPGLARRWREAVRESLGGLLDAGGRVEGFDRAGWYVVRTTSPHTPAQRSTP